MVADGVGWGGVNCKAKRPRRTEHSHPPPTTYCSKGAADRTPGEAARQGKSDPKETRKKAYNRSKGTFCRKPALGLD